MATALATDRHAVRGLGDRGRTTRVLEELRAVVLACTDEGHADGGTWATIAGNLGLWVTVLQRWRRQGEARHQGELRPVVVCEEELAPHAAALSLVTALGEKLEGLGVEDAIRLARASR